MKLVGRGQLRHHFFGEYSAGIGLEFDSAEAAVLALPHISPAGFTGEWQQSKDHPHYLVICVNSDQLALLVEHFGELGADKSAIDSVAHSIDFGDAFEITVCVDDPRQMMLNPM